MRVDERLLLLLLAARGPSAGRPTFRTRSALAVAQLAELAERGELKGDLAEDHVAARRSMVRMSETRDSITATSRSLEQRGVVRRAFDAPWPWVVEEDLFVRRGALDVLGAARRVLTATEPDARDAAALLILRAMGDARLVLRREDVRALDRAREAWEAAPPASLARVLPYCRLAEDALAW